MIAIAEQVCDTAGLLDWASTRLDDPLASAIDIRLAGMATRLAFDLYLGELTMRLAPPRGIKWHAKAVRLLKAGHLDMAKYRRARQIERIASKAVHGGQFDRTRARLLFSMVSGFVE